MKINNIFVKADTKIIKMKYFSRKMLGNKDTAIVESCSTRSDSIEVGGMVFRELNNRIMFSVFSPVVSNISNSFVRCFHSSPHHLCTLS